MEPAGERDTELVGSLFLPHSPPPHEGFHHDSAEVLLMPPKLDHTSRSESLPGSPQAAGRDIGCLSQVQRRLGCNNPCSGAS